MIVLFLKKLHFSLFSLNFSLIIPCPAATEKELGDLRLEAEHLRDANEKLEQDAVDYEAITVERDDAIASLSLVQQLLELVVSDNPPPGIMDEIRSVMAKTESKARSMAYSNIAANKPRWSEIPTPVSHSQLVMHVIKTHRFGYS